MGMEEKRQAIHEFYSDLLGEREDEPVPPWIYKNFKLSDLENLRCINGGLVKEGASQLKLGKTCSDDMVVEEMLRELSDKVYELIAQAFVMRITNHSTEDDEACWDEQLVVLVEKIRGGMRVKDFRPLGVLPVLQKVYLMVLQKLSDPWTALSSRAQFAFRKHYQTEEVIFIMRMVVEIHRTGFPYIHNRWRCFESLRLHQAQLPDFDVASKERPEGLYRYKNSRSSTTEGSPQAGRHCDRERHQEE